MKVVIVAAFIAFAAPAGCLSFSSEVYLTISCQITINKNELAVEMRIKRIN